MIFETSMKTLKTMINDFSNKYNFETLKALVAMENLESFQSSFSSRIYSAKYSLKN